MSGDLNLSYLTSDAALKAGVPKGGPGSMTPSGTVTLGALYRPGPFPGLTEGRGPGARLSLHA